jgi:hypothetical protein
MTFENKPQIPDGQEPEELFNDDGIHEVTSVDLEMKPEEKKLMERPVMGFGALLAPYEAIEVREKIRQNPRLNEYYEKARKTLSGGKSGSEINRGQLINQLEIELTSGPISEFEACDQLIKIIREVIAKSGN